MISLKGVSKSYKGITIFEDVNITFMPNKWNFIEGVSERIREKRFIKAYMRI